MTAILGISAFYHDSAAALVVDGEIVAAAQEERFSRKKHDHRFPVNAMEADLVLDSLHWSGNNSSLETLLASQKVCKNNLWRSPHFFTDPETEKRVHA